MRCIDADELSRRMYTEAFLKDTDMQKWDSGCWIRYKLFENVLKEQPTIEPERKTGKWVGAIEYCKHLEETTGERYQPSSLAGMIYCNQCWKASDRRSNYCRECGAKMEEGDTP